MKVITVDDQFVNAKGKPMESVPLVMMAASEIGARQGQELYKEMQKRGWDVKDTAVMAITADELDTARRRTTGSIDALKAAASRTRKSTACRQNPTISRERSTPVTRCWSNIRRLNTG